MCRRRATHSRWREPTPIEEIHDDEPARTTRPTRSGEMLREDFLPDYALTTASLAGALGVSRQTVNEPLRERRVGTLVFLSLPSLRAERPC
jgi:hypothetical protein